MLDLDYSRHHGHVPRDIDLCRHSSAEEKIALSNAGIAVTLLGRESAPCGVKVDVRISTTQIVKREKSGQMQMYAPHAVTAV